VLFFGGEKRAEVRKSAKLKVSKTGTYLPNEHASPPKSEMKNKITKNENLNFFKK